MTIDKAIELLEIRNLHHPRTEYPDEWDAIKLGNEALKVILLCRRDPKSIATIPLSGETKE